MCSVIFIVVFVCLVNPSLSYFITVDAHAEECFFEKVESESKMSLTFEIAEGGFLDIDVRIIGPGHNIIHEAERQSSGKFTFPVKTPGIYTYCFSNKMSTMTPKVVMFNIFVGDNTKHVETADSESTTKLEDMIRELSGALSSVKQEQEYMHVRDRIHRSINESTNSRVVMWSFFETIVLLALTAGQVLYLKRFFEVRRVV